MELVEIKNEKEYPFATDEEGIQSLDECKEIEIDDFMDLIGLSRYHYIFLLSLSLIQMYEGSQLVVVSIVNVIFQDSNEVSKSMISIFGSSLFIGSLIGSLAGGYISDHFGRKRPLIINAGIMYVTGTFMGVFGSIYVQILCRFIYGIGMGIFGPIAYAFIAEVIPRNYRGVFLSFLGGVWSVGGIISVLIALSLNSTLNKVNWQLMTLILNQTALIAIFILHFYVEESPRFTLLAKNDLEGCKFLLLEIRRKSKKENIYEWDEDKFEMLGNWGKKVCFEHQTHESYFELFSKPLLQQTLSFFFIMFFLNYIYYGCVYITPKVYEDENKNIGTISLLYPNIAELFTGVLAALVIESEFFGRKKSLYFSSMLGLICAVGTSFLLSKDKTGFYFWLFVSGTRFFGNFSLIVVDSFAAESYPTNLRGKGIGAALAVGKIASAIMPFLMNPFLDIGEFMPFLVMALSYLIIIFLIFFAPRETRGERLED